MSILAKVLISGRTLATSALAPDCIKYKINDPFSYDNYDNQSLMSLENNSGASLKKLSNHALYL